MAAQARGLAALPYRPCVGIMVLSCDGLVWAGNRAWAHSNDAEGPESWWQMPQGGVDANEDLDRAALRELAEETGIRSVSILAASRGWYVYDFPPQFVGRQRGTVYRGQRQKWFAVRFLGDDDEIDISAGPDALPEFTQWRWLPMGELAKLVAPFKRQVYTEVVAEFARWGASVGDSPKKPSPRR